MAMKITKEVLEAHLNCKFKGHLKLVGEVGTRTDYEAMTTAARAASREQAIAKLVARSGEEATCVGTTVAVTTLRSGPPLLADVKLEDESFSLRFEALKRVPGPSRLGEHHFLPVLHHDGEKVGRQQKVLLAVLGLVLARVQGVRPTAGLVARGPDARLGRVRLDSKAFRQAEQVIKELQLIQAGGEPPRLTLNAHCQVCEFRQRCQDQALAADDLSLLRGMGEREIANLRRRGIFTVTQLSCTYRPRRVTVKDRRRGRGHAFALQALAIREKKIHVLGSPELPNNPVRIYFDIEGSPERASAYLLGMIVEEDGSERRFSFWADGEGQERQVLEGFLDVVEGYEDYHLFCYGSFEVSFLKRLRRTDWQERIDPILARTTNILPVIYSSVYFPVYSNGLKEIGGHLGFHWTAPDASGIGCIVWRKRWEESHDYELRRKIEVYNLDDCAALQTVCRFIRWIGAGRDGMDSPREGNESMPTYCRQEEFVIPFGRREWCKAKFCLPDFDHINKLSYFDYQRDRVFIRSSKSLRKARSRARRGRGRKEVKVAEKFEIRCLECPSCKGAQLAEWPDGRLSRIVLDLKISVGGLRRRFVQVASPRYRCQECRRSFAPPDYYRVDRHSHPLKSWAMYEHIAHRASFRSLEGSFKECFGLRVHWREIQVFKHLMARFYTATFEQLRMKIVAGKLIHADETEVTLKEIGKVYVWVFTNLEEVIYLYRPSREGDFLHEFLKGFDGVLVSDFYAAYDSLPCAQQKCLIHLIRDLNQDILSNPFDEELKALAADFGELLRAAVTTIDRHGLSRRHLRKHEGGVRRFYEAVSGHVYQSEVAQGYQRRFEKYQGSLFTFLDHDGVPWNNNNAEHAIKTFAHYREIMDGMMTEGGLKDYLTLLSIHQSCVYKGISFLRFLVSQERDIDRFCEMGRRSPEVPPYDLYPEGYIPSYRRHKTSRTGEPPAE
jgi:predicted RecB family nuclease